MSPIGSEPHAAEFLAEVRATQARLTEKYRGARCLAFGDFDGTLLRGDCSLGLTERGRETFPGLVRLGIERGLAADYPEERGYLACRDDYEELERRCGGWLAYPFLAQVFAGAERRVLEQLATDHFKESLRKHYFVVSSALFDGLAAAGVEQHVVSASPEFFVQGAAESLGLPRERLHGIRVREADGLLTRELIYPVPFGDGKVELLRAIVAAAQAKTPEQPVFAVAAFGNNFATDGPFVAHVARQELPEGKPLAVMINAGLVPAEYRRLFRSVRQVRVVTRG